MTTLLGTGNEIHRHDAMALFPAELSSSGMDVLRLDGQSRLVDGLLRLGQLRGLGPDWNSYGSPPPSESLIRFAEAFLEVSDRALAPFLPAPHVVPVSGGGIKFTWINNAREVEIEFGPSGDKTTEVEFLCVSHGEPLREGPVSEFGEILDHLTWVIQG